MDLADRLEIALTADRGQWRLVSSSWGAETHANLMLRAGLFSWSLGRTPTVLQALELPLQRAGDGAI